MRITVDPGTHRLNHRSSPAAMLFILGIVAVRQGLRNQTVDRALGLDTAAVTNIAIALVLGLLTAQRIEMWLRAPPARRGVATLTCGARGAEAICLGVAPGGRTVGMKVGSWRRAVATLALGGALVALTAADDPVPAKDAEGRTVLRGPQHEGYYNNVHIVSDTVGIENYSGVSLTNSVIEARVCVVVGPFGNRIDGNELRCGGCVKFPMGPLRNNQVSNNRCAGQLTNRPDAFGM
jgi:hypothetical protein